jgi:UDP-N-acetylmuramate dehydrogenase
MNTQGLRGTQFVDESLARHTSWRVGGPARRLYRPADAGDLAGRLRRLDPGEPRLWIGLGSILLVSDAGSPGTVVETQGRLVGYREVGGPDGEWFLEAEPTLAPGGVEPTNGIGLVTEVKQIGGTVT